ncbi:MAG: hypothetical protein AB7P76_07055 [Candidatus Melainabacteria bacterium]
MPIPKRFIQDKFRNASPARLARHGLIDIDRKYVPGKRPRRYRLRDWVLDGFIEASIAAQDTSPRLVSILTGKPLRASQKAPEAAESSSGDPTPPDLIQRAMGMFTACTVDRPAIVERLNRLRAVYQDNPTPKNRFRYLNDWFIWDTLNKLAEPTDTPGIVRFTPRYTMQATGRIGTPLQNASRAMKQAAYAAIPNVHNYDLASSQMALCLHEMTRHGIDCPWIRTYLDEPGTRAALAEQVGVSDATWKECLYSVLMTAHLPTNTVWKGSPVVEALAEEITDSAALKETLARLREVLKPLVPPLKKWHKQVESEGRAAGCIVNRLGISRPVESFDKTSAMVAHILQGSEAYFIHTLTVLAERYGYTPLGNEHDGLLTIGPIPDAAIQQAQRLTGLDCLELREKPFCE